MAGDKLNTFTGKLEKEVPDAYNSEGSVSHARNCTNNSITGDSPSRQNESANGLLISAPYDIIGTIYLYDDLWAVMSTDDSQSELGIFREATNTYTQLIRDSGLNWNRRNLITGEAKMNFDCSWSIYISDKHRNPDRVINLSNIPYRGQFVTNSSGCRSFVPDSPRVLDTDKIKLYPPTLLPCITLTPGASGGNLFNGTYYALIAYSLNGERVTHYSNLSNPISLFSHNNETGSINIKLSELDETYDQYQLVVIAVVNQQTTAKTLGYYGIGQRHVVVDFIAPDLEPVELFTLPVITPLLSSSDSISQLNSHLIRVAPKSKFDFNYQPLANQITTKFVIAEYPANYYAQGGTNLSFLGDEVYAFFIRWVYDDSDKSPSFHIPGRAPFSGETSIVTGIFDNTYQFENVNSALITNTSITDLGDGGFYIAEGDMGYWQSEEIYPDDKPQVWGSLCGKNIRHHKFPERSSAGLNNIYTASPTSPIVGPAIRILGVRFLDIKGPVDNQGIPITNVVGYEILVGSREGNKSVIARGIINNTFQYDLTDDSGKQGIYANFPYNSLSPDPFISSTQTGTTAMTGAINNFTPNTSFRKDLVTFHSPDTSFRHPFLSAQELKLHGIVNGFTNLKFNVPDEHPKHKLPTNLAFFIASITGLGLAVVKMVGETITAIENSIIEGSTAVSNSGVYVGVTSGATVGYQAIIAALALAQFAGVVSSNVDDDNSINNVKENSGNVVAARDNTVKPLESQARKSTSTTGLTTGIFGGGKKTTSSSGGVGGAIGDFLRGSAMGGISLFTQLWAEGADSILTVIMNLSQFQQYALQQTSHCFYDGFYPVVPSRYGISLAKYVGQAFEEFDDSTRINNLYRNSTVVVKTTVDMTTPYDDEPLAIDNSKQSLATIFAGFPGAGSIYETPTKIFAQTQACSYYASLKERLRSQYGQIANVKQVPQTCVNYVEVTPTVSINHYDSATIFGGDVYITRYTEKNTMFFFFDWLYKEFDGFEFDYLKSRMLQFPAYWANTSKFDVGDMTRGVSQNLGGSISAVVGNTSGNQQLNAYNNTQWLPTGFRALDRKAGTQDGFTGGSSFTKQSFFVVKEAYLYLFVSGVRDFYVESEVNVAYRDWEDPIQKRHYDHSTFTDLPALFNANPDIIKADNFYKYDYSLSASRSFVNMSSWANVQPSYYDPIIAKTCFVKHPKRFQYSLPQDAQQQASILDRWRIFLTNNYKEFTSNITAVKSFGQTGSLMVFESNVPLIIQGDETLQFSATKIIIGDGAFLARPAQNLTNADRVYQIGATKDLRSVVNTPAGLFWMSPDQAKIFTVRDGLLDIVMPDLNWWYAKYMPYKLLEDFPDFDLIGNALMGIACQTIYDNESGIIYFSKKDYKLLALQEGQSVRYFPDGLTSGLLNSNDSGVTSGHFGLFGSNPNTPIYLFELGNPQYFENCSWTMSYDTKRSSWLSWHDWHPDLTMASKTTFCTISGSGIWRHNQRCDLYCNYYGVDYPFEIEYEHSTGVDVRTFRSIEHYLEAYKYADNCYDRYMYNSEYFDEAVVFNNEQCSGLLKFTLRDSLDPFTALNYPIYNLSNTDILYSKVESKYRFNMALDLTDDRGISGFARRPIWETSENGYIKILNPLNLNYQKELTQQKKFRGYVCSVFLRRKVSGAVKLIMLFANNKTQESKR